MSRKKYIFLIVLLSISIVLSILKYTLKTDKPIINIEKDDTYSNYLKEVIKINSKIDTIRNERSKVVNEKIIVKEKYYYEREKVSNFNLDKLDSSVRSLSNIS